VAPDQSQAPGEAELERRRRWLEAHRDWIPCKLPHFSSKEDGFHFLAEARPRLAATPALIQALATVDGRADVAAVLADEGKVASLAQLWAAGLVTLVPPETVQAGPRIVAIEPHPDDVALSAGGALLSRRDSARKTLLSVASRTNGTFYMATPELRYFDVATISELREAESRLVARFLKADYLTLGEPDIAIRYIDPERYIKDDIRATMRDYGAQRYAPPPRSLVERLSRLLWRALQPLSPDEIWLPLGAGNHFDHRLTRDACLHLIGTHWHDLQAVKIMCYEDLPYAWESTGSAGAVVQSLRRRGAELERQPIEIGEMIADKLECLRIYASQLEGEKIRPIIAGYARMAAPAVDGYSETLWRLTRPPTLPLAPILVARGAPDGSLEDAARRVFARRAQARRLGLLVGQKVWNWIEQAQLLLELFPNARIDVLASRANRDELAAVHDPRLRVSLFEQSPSRLLISLIKWAAHVNDIVLIFGGPRWTSNARFLGKALPSRSVYAFESLADLCDLWRYWLEQGRDGKSEAG
jgi:LmbE family N-acetylglucosaminyl deacetylase